MKQSNDSKSKIKLPKFITILIILVAIFLYIEYQIDFFPFLFSTFDDPGFPIELEDYQLIKHTYFTLSYNEKFEQPNWVMYKLQSKNITKSNHKRGNNFRMDPLITSKSASTSDYRNSGYDKGHLVPAADMAWSDSAISETFYMSNMSPQHPKFNRGIWKNLESQVRDWTIVNEELFVVTGPIFSETISTIGKNQVVVPKYYYKIVLDIKKPELKAIAFIMENKDLSGSFFDYAVSIDSVEKFTQINFFRNFLMTLKTN